MFFSYISLVFNIYFVCNLISQKLQNKLCTDDNLLSSFVSLSNHRLCLERNNVYLRTQNKIKTRAFRSDKHILKLQKRANHYWPKKTARQEILLQPITRPGMVVQKPGHKEITLKEKHPFAHAQIPTHLFQNETLSYRSVFKSRHKWHITTTLELRKGKTMSLLPTSTWKLRKRRKMAAGAICKTSHHVRIFTYVTTKTSPKASEIIYCAFVDCFNGVVNEKPALL